MKKLPLLAAVAVLAAWGATAPAQARVVIGLDVPLIVAAPPVAPPEIYEAVPPPRPGYYWNPGYQRWNGAGYVWIGGSWGRGNRRGRVWSQPGWGREGGGWRYHQGRWR